METEGVMGRRVICDGLLCSILHGLSSSVANEDEFISVIERDTSDILKARKRLFTYYDKEICSEQKKLTR